MDDLETVQGCSADPMKSTMLDYQEVTTEITRLQGAQALLQSNSIRSLSNTLPKEKSRLLTGGLVE